MFIAMNTFTVNSERANEFDEIWTTRERHLAGMKGFVKFQLLKGEDNEGKREYISHSTWENSEDFWAWTKSEEFKLAHKNRTPEGIILGPPRFRSYEVILEE